MNKEESYFIKGYYYDGPKSDDILKSGFSNVIKKYVRERRVNIIGADYSDGTYWYVELQLTKETSINLLTDLMLNAGGAFTVTSVY